MMRRHIFNLLFVLLLFVIAGCGASGVAAPPVDLPAPITGRVDVGAPDANGNVAITGTEGAVEGGALVMAVNETSAGTQATRILDWLVRSAYAAGETYPAICSETGHACTYANSDGSFVLYIVAAEGDDIAIGIIDATTGSFISELLRMPVPASGTPTPSANCSGMGVSGDPVDMKIAPTSGTPLVLKQGSDTTTNSIVIGSSSSTEVAISGCHAHTLAIQASPLGDLVVATSKEDKILWAARLVNGELHDSRSFTLTGEPMHVAFDGVQTAPLIAIYDGSTTTLNRISLTKGEAIESMAIGSPQVAGLTESLSLTIISQGFMNQSIGVLLTIRGVSSDPFITLFRADDLTFYGNAMAQDLNKWNTALPPLSSLTYATIDAVDNATQTPLRILVLDGVGKLFIPLQINVLKAGPPEVLERATDLGTVAGLSTFLIPINVNALPVTAGELSQITTSAQISGNSTMALISTGGDTMYHHLIGSDDSLNNAFQYEWPVGSQVHHVEVNDSSKLCYGLDLTTGKAILPTSNIDWK